VRTLAYQKPQSKNEELVRRNKQEKDKTSLAGETAFS
jgi:hypothetical protein